MQHPFEQNFINGKWCRPASNAWLDVINPATLEHFARVPDSSTEDADAAVRAAHAALPDWSATPLSLRIALMKKMLAEFKKSHDEIILLEARELGAPVSFGKISHCEYQFTRIESYIAVAETLKFQTQFAKSTVLREPVGVVACITPWNYPLGQIVQKVIPALLAGNTVVMKPSQHTPLTAVLMTEAFERAGFPAGVVNLVSGRGSKLGDTLGTHPLVDMVSFTGSTPVGIALAQKALTSVKRISLELGGKSPYIWLPSEDYSKALAKLFSSIFLNSGQTCTALSRLLVPAKDLEKVKRLILEHIGELTVGNPEDPSVKIGPVATKQQFEKISEYIRLGLKEGAKLLTGGVPEEPKHGYYIAPTVFYDVKNTMRIAREEIFGPVLCIITYETVDEAVEIANDTIYGLNAAVFGKKDEAFAVARRIKSGNVYINDAGRDVTAPFGGYKQSGIGREGGIEGLKEFTQLKAVYDHSTF